MIPVSIISLVLLMRPWMWVMSRRLRIMPAAMPLLIAWTTIRAIQQEQFHMTQTGMPTMITAILVHGLIAVVVRNVRVQRLFVLAVIVFSVLWMLIAGFA